MRNIDELAAEIRLINHQNGWKVFMSYDWAENEYKFPAVIALIHSEITEAFEELDIGRTEDLLTELADVKIRTLDLAGGLTKDFQKYFDQSTLFYQTELTDLLGMHKDASEALESYRDNHKERALAYLAHLVMRIDNFVDRYYADDFDDILRAKLEENRARTYRYGGKRV